MGNIDPEVEKIILEMKEKAEQNMQTSMPAYRCSKCGDTGWLHFKTENGYEVSDKCSCRLAREAEDRIRASGLADALKEQTFETFKAETPLQKHMKMIAQDYTQTLLDNWDSPRRPWLFFGGNPGAGKTHICTAVCGEILRHNISVVYMQWLQESRKLKYAVNDENFEDAVSDFVNPTVLYIDDLLKQKYVEEPTFTEADIKIAFTILNARYIQNKPTIISTEWDLINQLLSADEGVFSRVYERCKGFTVRISRDQKNNYRMNGGLG